MSVAFQTLVEACRDLRTGTGASFDQLAAVYEDYVRGGAQREDRSATEQNLFTAIERCVLFLGATPELLTNASGIVRSSFLEEVETELKFYEAPEAFAGLPPLNIGHLITPEEWVAENPLTLADAAQVVVDGITCVVPTVILDNHVQKLREALLNEEDEKLKTEPGLVEAVQGFVRAYKAHKMLGDSLVPATELLVAALKPETNTEDPQAAVPYLYILMRNDLASMNAGKAVAQGTHAANQMVFEGRKLIATSEITPVETLYAFEELLDAWENAANGFGTCIVLAVNERQMRDTVKAAQDAGFHANLTHDPSYPLRDGASFHLIPLDTCAYVFGRKADLKPFVGQFPLMP